MRAPDGWRAEPAELRFDRLAPHERRDVAVTVAVPEGTPGGDYTLDLAAEVGRHIYTSEATVSVIGPTTTVDLSGVFDNDGISTEANPQDGDFDGSGYTYPAEQLPPAGEVRFGQVPYLFGSGADGALNNLVTDGRALALPARRYRRVHVLTSASYGPAQATATVAYADGTTQQLPLSVPDWASGGDDGVIRSGWRHGPNGRDGLAVSILYVPADAPDGRYDVTVSVSTDDWTLRIPVRLAVERPNLALGKPATQSSVDYGGLPARAVDGTTSGAWSGGSVTHTRVEDQPWWQVDLGDRHSIGQIAIWNRTDSCCAGRLSDYHVLVSDDPFASGSLEEVLAQPGVWAHHEPRQAGSPTTIDVGRSGRYVRVQLAGTNALSLAEVQVLAGPDPPS